MHSISKSTNEVAPVVLGFNYEAHSASSYKFNTSATSFGFGHPNTDIGAICGHYFRPYFHWVCAESAISHPLLNVVYRRFHKKD